jgi:hypothetical protein
MLVLLTRSFLQRLTFNSTRYPISGTILLGLTTYVFLLHVMTLLTILQHICTTRPYANGRNHCSRNVVCCGNHGGLPSSRGSRAYVWGVGWMPNRRETEFRLGSGCRWVYGMGRLAWTLYHIMHFGNQCLAITYNAYDSDSTKPTLYQNSFLTSRASLANRFLHVHPALAFCRSDSRASRRDFETGASRARRCDWLAGIENLHRDQDVFVLWNPGTYRSASAFLDMVGFSALILCISATTSSVNPSTTFNPSASLGVRFNGAPACALARTSFAPRVHRRMSGIAPDV